MPYFAATDAILATSGGSSGGRVRRGAGEPSSLTNPSKPAGKVKVNIRAGC